MGWGNYNGPNSRRGASPAHLNAANKKVVGFLNFITVENNIENVILANIELNDTAYKIGPFILENRQRIGFDHYLPGWQTNDPLGLLIWHDKGSKQDLEQADNESDFDAGDPFPGTSNKTEFTPITTLNSNGYRDGISGPQVIATGVAVKDITLNNNIIQADLYTNHWGGEIRTYDLTWSGENFVVADVEVINVDTYIDDWGNATYHALYIEPGSTIKFSDNTSLILSHSNLCAEGTSQDSIFFTRESGTGNWVGIKLKGYDSPPPHSLDISKIEYASLAFADHPVKVEESSAATIKNSLIQNANIGVYIDNTSPTVDHIKIKDCSLKGIHVSGSNAKPIIKFSEVKNTTYEALYIYNDADPDVFESKFCATGGPGVNIYSADGLFCGNEFRTSSGGYCVVVNGSTSRPEFNDDYYQGNLWDMTYIAGSRAVNIAGGRPEFGDYPTHTGANDFLHVGANEYYIWNSTSNTILAEGNYWGAYEPNDNWFYGSVDKTPYEHNSQNAGPSWKISPSLYNEALIAYDSGNYKEAMQMFETLLNSEPQHERIANIAFLFAKSAAKIGLLEQKLETLENFTLEHDNPEVNHVYRVWKSYYYASIGNLEQSKAVSLSAPAGSTSERELLLSLIGYYISNDDRAGAEDIASILRDHRTDDPTLEEDIEMMLNSPKLSLEKQAQSKPALSVQAEEQAVALGAYPNPFNASSKISFATISPARVELKIFNTLGQQVRTLVSGWRDSGRHHVIWDGRDDAGHFSSSGIYFVVLNIDGKIKTTKIAYVR